VLRVDGGPAFLAHIRTTRRALAWHAKWSPVERRIRWSDVESCMAERDRRLGVTRHTNRLVLITTRGRLEVINRGLPGALVLAALRDVIRERAWLVADRTNPPWYVRGAHADRERSAL
jgi:hypothetical protein